MKVDYFLWVDIKNSEKRVKSFFTVDWALKAYFQGDFGGFCGSSDELRESLD